MQFELNLICFQIISKGIECWRMDIRKFTTKKIDSYDIGRGLRLINIKHYNAEGKLDSVETYIAADGNGFSCVGTT